MIYTDAEVQEAAPAAHAPKVSDADGAAAPQAGSASIAPSTFEDWQLDENDWAIIAAASP